MNMNNNTIFCICGTVLGLAILATISTGVLEEQVNLVLAGGLVAVATGLVSNIQRKIDDFGDNEGIEEIIEEGG